MNRLVVMFDLAEINCKGRTSLVQPAWASIEPICQVDSSNVPTRNEVINDVQAVMRGPARLQWWICPQGKGQDGGC
jgi:hypothetical protein